MLAIVRQTEFQANAPHDPSQSLLNQNLTGLLNIGLDLGDQLRDAGKAFFLPKSGHKLYRYRIVINILIKIEDMNFEG